MELNTELEQAYFSARSKVLVGDPDPERVKYAVVVDSAKLIARITELPVSAVERSQLLGSVGCYLASCRRSPRSLLVRWRPRTTSCPTRHARSAIVNLLAATG